ncbi:MAG: hypothetical protein HRU14_15795, partial [Planctomycetes bacterium]|nr:hypothetical protein [Planctomycetota bacterium]
MIVSSPIANLINGVSQQPYSLRLASQAEAVSNFNPTPVEGLRRRPPTTHVAALSSTNWESGFIHPIDRDNVEQYLVKIVDGDLKVFDLAGVEQTVNFPSGKTYLAGTAADFKAVTVADYTFIVNRSVTVAMDPALTSQRDPEALVSIRQGNYGRTFKIFINGVAQATFTTPDGDTAADVRQIDTDYIAAQLKAELDANLDPAEFAMFRVASTIRIRSLTATDFTIFAEDGSGGTGSVVVKGQVQRFTDLPRAAFKHFAVEVVGDNTSAFDNYYVDYDREAATRATDGTWVEPVQGHI